MTPAVQHPGAGVTGAIEANFGPDLTRNGRQHADELQGIGEAVHSDLKCSVSGRQLDLLIFPKIEMGEVMRWPNPAIEVHLLLAIGPGPEGEVKVVDPAVQKDQAVTFDLYGFMKIGGPDDQIRIVAKEPQLEIGKPWSRRDEAITRQDHPAARG